MASENNLFDGFRPSDLRFDNAHVLSEYIARAQRVVDSANQIQESSKDLVLVAMKSAEDCVKSIQSAQLQMKVEFNALLAHVTRSVSDTGSNVAKVVAGAHAFGGDYLSSMGEALRIRHEALEARADAIERTAARVEKAADKLQELNERVRDELEQLRRYKVELTRYEHASLKQVSDAEQRLYKGLSLTDRIWLVFFPRVVEAKIGKPPSRPTSTLDLAGPASARSVSAVGGRVGQAGLIGGATRK